MKTVKWVGSSLEDLQKLPPAVRTTVGQALYEAQLGGKHGCAKVLKGFSGAKVLEVVDNYRGNAYRAVYTTKHPEAIYVLHVFQKKSKRGISTPKEDAHLIKERLKRIEEG